MNTNSFKEIYVQHLRGDMNGTFTIRANQHLHLSNATIGTNLLILESASFSVDPSSNPLLIPLGIKLSVSGHICGVQDIMISGGTLLLGRNGATACVDSRSPMPPPGIYNFGRIFVMNGTFTAEQPNPKVNAIVCKSDNALIENIDLNSTILPLTDSRCIWVPTTTTTGQIPVGTTTTTTSSTTGPPTCGPGFFNNGTSCIKIDVCGTNNGNCNFMVTCTNLGNGSRTCGSCPRGTNGTGETTCKSLCGNDACESNVGENCVSCPADCDSSTCDVCGDNLCDAVAGETCRTCFADCGACIPLTCYANCNNATRQGTCVNGLCQCTENWSGPYCNLPKNQPVNITYSETTPDIKLSSPATSSSNSNELTKFSILIKRIAEKNSTGEIRAVEIPNIVFARTVTVSGPNNLTTLSNYSARLENGAILNVIVVQFEEQGSTLYNFAGTNFSFASHTLKFGISVRNWPFLSLTNTLAIVFDANGESAEQKACSSVDESGSLRWLTLNVGNISLYGQFIERAVIDGRQRTISFLLNSADNTVSAILPHFWAFAEMDPNYSVLLGDTSFRDVCSKLTETKKKNKINKTVIAIVVPVVVVGVILAGVGVWLFPRFKTWLQVQSRTKVPSMTEMSMTNSESI